MKIALHQGRQASEEEIDAVEAVLGHALSDSFRAFLKNNDCAEPEPNSFDIGEDNGSSVRRFLPMVEIAEERQSLGELAARYYPVAEDSCGNYVVLDVLQGAVFFWDHEMEEPLTRLADDFAAFLDVLQPFDACSVRSIPVKVESVWIDPEFRKLLQEQGDRPAADRGNRLARFVKALFKSS